MIIKAEINNDLYLITKVTSSVPVKIICEKIDSLVENIDSQSQVVRGEVDRCKVSVQSLNQL